MCFLALTRPGVLGLWCSSARRPRWIGGRERRTCALHVCRRTDVDGGVEAAAVPIFVAAQGHALPSRATQ